MSKQWQPLVLLAEHRRNAARQYVIKTLAEYCEASPLADEPDYSNGAFGEEDMRGALLDVKQFLEATSLIMEGVEP